AFWAVMQHESNTNNILSLYRADNYSLALKSEFLYFPTDTAVSFAESLFLLFSHLTQLQKQSFPLQPNVPVKIKLLQSLVHIDHNSCPHSLIIQDSLC